MEKKIIFEQLRKVMDDYVIRVNKRGEFNKSDVQDEFVSEVLAIYNKRHDKKVRDILLRLDIEILKECLEIGKTL